MDLQLNKKKKRTPDKCKTRMRHKNILLSERNFTHKNVHIVLFYLYEVLRQNQIHGEKIRMEVVFEVQRVRTGSVHERIVWSYGNVTLIEVWVRQMSLPKLRGYILQICAFHHM